MLEDERLGNYGTGTTWSDDLNDRHEQMSHQDEPLPHA